LGSGGGSDGESYGESDGEGDRAIPMRVTISGPPGSGTTTVAKLLAKKLNFELISAGEVFRKIAKEKKMSLAELSRLADTNPEIDLEIDRYQKELAENKANVVVEGRLSGWMVNADLKVWLFASEDIRVERIARREKKSIDEAKRETKEREKIEKRRYEKYYGIDIDDWTIYHLVINSGYFTPDEIVEIIIKAIEGIKE
jgi:cytidylate kinase